MTEETGPLVQMFGSLEIRVDNIRIGRTAAIRGGSLEAGTATGDDHL